MSHEFLHTTGLARGVGKVGLVSQIHSPEQRRRAKALADAGIELFVRENNLDERPPEPRIGERAYHVFRSLSRRPLDASMEDFTFAGMAVPLMRALGAARWDVLMVVQSSNAHFVDWLPEFSARILVLHDIRSLVYQRRANAIGKPLSKALNRIEAERYFRFERSYCGKYDLVVTVSETDRRWVERHYRPRRAIAIPLMIDDRYFAPPRTIQTDGARIVLTGMMNHPPNTDAACFFGREVFPTVLRAIPEAEFWIVGRDPTPEVLSLATRANVFVTGAVADIREHLSRATVVVAPIRFSSGARNKILEAWGMRKPVVATTLGAEGLDAEDGVDLFLADDAAGMASRVTELVRDPALCGVLGEGGHARLGRHQPELLEAEYFPLIRRLAGARRTDPHPSTTVVDLRWMMRSGLAGGAENLTRSLLEHLTGIDRTNRYRLLTAPSMRYEHDAAAADNVEVLVVDGPARAMKRLSARARARFLSRLNLPFIAEENVERLRFLHELEADVALSPQGWIRPDLFGLRNVLLLLDLQHLHHPRFFTPERLEERERVYGSSVRKADFTVAISEFTRRVAIERYGIPPDRITSAWLAADDRFRPGLVTPRGRRSVLARHGLEEGGYLFFPAHTWRHKNHVSALRALALLRDDRGLTPSLVCTGEPREAQPEIEDLVSRLRLDRQVRFLGYCPLEEMPVLYEAAAALVFPSIYEGFGMPVVEAMSMGCPVVCSNAASLPEIAGDAALLVDPHDDEGLADALSRVLTDSDVRRDLTLRGVARSRLFSWEGFSLSVLKALHHARTA
jgi:glycosyltransferase involved in cell wall biosynthesis